MTEPLYKQVYKTLLQRIALGNYLPGAKLPSEFDIADELKVSQGTARKAVLALEQKGIVQRRQGKGTFVTLRTPENSLFHFFRMRSATDGEQVAPELLSSRIKTRNARKHERGVLFGEPAKVFEITRIRTYNGAPLCHERIILPVALFPGLPERDPLPNALYVLFQRAYSCIVIEAEESLTAEALEAPLADLLEVQAGTPAIVARRQARDLMGRTVELRSTTLLTHAAAYQITLQ